MINEQEATVEMLLESEGGRRMVGGRDDRGFTPTHLACVLNHLGVLGLLMQVLECISMFYGLFCNLFKFINAFFCSHLIFVHSFLKCYKSIENVINKLLNC